MKIIDNHKKNGYKYPLLACLFLLFYNSGKNTLKKSELYSLMEKEAINNKNKIISSPTERFCIITPKNYKSKIKDMIKKKKWFTKKFNDIGESEYTLNPGAVSSVVPKIILYLKVLVKNDFMFKFKEDKIEEESENEIKKDNIKETIKDKKQTTKRDINKNKDSINKNKVDEKNINIKDSVINQSDYDIIIEDDKDESEDEDEDENKNTQKLFVNNFQIKKEKLVDNEKSKRTNNKNNNKINNGNALGNIYLNQKRKSNKIKYNNKKIIKNNKDKSKEKRKPSLISEINEFKNCIEEITEEDTNNDNTRKKIN